MSEERDSNSKPDIISRKQDIGRMLSGQTNTTEVQSSTVGARNFQSTRGEFWGLYVPWLLYRMLAMHVETDAADNLVE